MMDSTKVDKHMAEVESLLQRMSMQEKIAQLQIGYRPNFEEALALVRAGIGAVFWPRDAAKTNKMQRVAKEETSHGIPLLVGLDVIHGQYTIFPTPIAQASSFDPSVPSADARFSAREARSGGVNWTFSPMVDVARDPRWGRVVEGFGEDPYLNTVMGVAKVHGYQGASLSDPFSLLACAKHYVAYSQAEGGRDYNTVDISEQRLRNVYLEPFKALVDAGVGTVMAAFNTVSGRPAHANRYLLTDILKHEWKHAGFVVGDADGIPNLIAHGIATGLEDALVQAFDAGLDMDMGAYAMDRKGAPAFDTSSLPALRIDDAVRRILKIKFAMGLFDDPYVDPHQASTGPTEHSRKAARSAAVSSIVLMKNDGTLPIGNHAKRILLAGPYAQCHDHLGAWTQSFASPAGTLFEELRNRLVDVEITTLQGAVFEGAAPELQAQVCEAAKQHDLILVIVGEPSKFTGEASARSNLRLPGDQETLIRSVASTGVPFAVVMANGRPLVLSNWIDLAPALLEVWHLGTEAVAAIADVLIGEANPGGKLPMSFPRSEAQIPIYYNHENTGRPARYNSQTSDGAPDIGLHGPDNTNDYFTSKYLDLELGPLFCFGHGLSYTRFWIGTPTAQIAILSYEELRQGANFEISVELINVGLCEGDEVVQLYVRDEVASLAQPIRRLRGFQRMTLAAGETVNVKFSIGWDDLGFWNNKIPASYDVEPGSFEIHVGGSIAHTKVVALKVVV